MCVGVLWVLSSCVSGCGVYVTVRDIQGAMRFMCEWMWCVCWFGVGVEFLRVSCELGYMCMLVWCGCGVRACQLCVSCALCV